MGWRFCLRVGRSGRRKMDSYSEEAEVVDADLGCAIF